ncbi:hypothetical protein HPB52_004899 [Rhipicephalus sanguineus]|uniref:Uncharacterized protein n=1 Tax=Rhipicephalus sanguineus TaxID=34632 RepID=A0A9D4PLF2_RHISA|nr:hypothetical protein HPB52_004899 [Rhipicephalus sanguineus]
MRCPVLLPADHHCTYLIVDSTHPRLLHNGPGGGREGWRALLRNLGRSSNPVGQGHTLTDARQQLQTRAKPAPKTPAKPGRGATKASTRSKKEESEGEEAASVEEASTAAANEDGSADSKEKEDEEELRRWCHVCV